jgi:MGT family glycosyltransferase
VPKALFFNVPAHGHVNPSLPLVAELTRRGHKVIYYLTEGFRAKVEAAGAEFRPYTRIHDDYFGGEGLDGSRPMYAARHLMKTTAELLPDLIENARAEKPDYIMFDGMCPWGQLLPRIVNVPSVASLSLPPVGSIRALMNWHTIRSLVPMMLKDFGAGQEANRIAGEVAKQYSVPSLGMMGIMNGLGDLSISYLSSYFQADADSVSPTVRFVGRVLEDTPPHTSFPFDLARGRRIVYISLGSLINENVDFFKACIEAFTGADEYVIMSTGRGISPQVFGTLPENIAIYEWVPQIDILKRAALFITHGGLGSVSDGLYFGLPLLLVPQQDEQTFTAMRVADLGAGLMLKKAQVTAHTLRENARKLLTDPRYRQESTRIGETMREAGGVARAVDEIEALLSQRKIS